jgi:hypothetical protein
MKLKTIIFAIIAIFGPLLLIEGATRLFLGSAIERRMTFEQRVRDAGGKIFRRVERDGRAVYTSDFVPSRYYLADTSDRVTFVAADKAPRSYRVLVLGGSDVAGSPFGPWASFARFLEDGLASVARPGTHVEVLNMGVSNGSSGTARLILDRSRFLEPDLVILYAGHNEFRDVIGLARDEAAIRDCGPWGDLEGVGQVVADYSYTYRMLSIIFRKLARKFQGDRKPREVDAACRTDRVFVRNTADRDRVYERYRANVLAIVGISKEMGADILLLSQPVNLFYPPNDFDTSPPERDEAVSRLAGAFKGQDEEAFRQARAALVAMDPEHPAISYYDGLQALVADRPELARRYLDDAVARNRIPNRYAPYLSTILVDIARADPAVTFVDTRERARELTPDGMADGRVFADLAHPAMELNKFFADTIMRAYFIGQRVRPDLFDYRDYASWAIYRPIAEEASYGLICHRYFRNEDWHACAQEALDVWRKTDKPGRIDFHRRAARAWELLFYYGRVHGASDLIDTALQIYKPRTPVAERSD